MKYLRTLFSRGDALISWVIHKVGIYQTVLHVFDPLRLEYDCVFVGSVTDEKGIT